MSAIIHIRLAAPAVLAAVVATATPPSASAQLPVGPFGPQQNFSYYGGLGPYGWGPYGFGWGGYSVVGYQPPMPPAGEAPPASYAVTSGAVRPPTAADLLRRQAEAAAWRDRQREALRMEAKFDVTTGRPRDVPAQAAPAPLPLDRRLETLFRPDGTVAWPTGMAGSAPEARQAVEAASRFVLEQFRLQGRADVADVASAREALSTYSGAVFARLAATDDPLSYQAAVDFFQRLDATLIDLADPPAPALEVGSPAEGGAPAPE